MSDLGFISTAALFGSTKHEFILCFESGPSQRSPGGTRLQDRTICSPLPPPASLFSLVSASSSVSFYSFSSCFVLLLLLILLLQFILLLLSFCYYFFLFAVSSFLCSSLFVFIPSPIFPSSISVLPPPFLSLVPFASLLCSFLLMQSQFPLTRILLRPFHSSIIPFILSIAVSLFSLLFSSLFSHLIQSSTSQFFLSLFSSLRHPVPPFFSLYFVALKPLSPLTVSSPSLLPFLPPSFPPFPPPPSSPLPSLLPPRPSIRPPRRCVGWLPGTERNPGITRERFNAIEKRVRTLLLLSDLRLPVHLLGLRGLLVNCGLRCLCGSVFMTVRKQLVGGVGG